MPDRFSVAQLMIAMALLSVNLAEASAIGEFEATGLYISAPILICIQWGFYQIVFRPNDRRPFWYGFIAAGLAATTTLFWAYLRNATTHKILFYTDVRIWNSIARAAPAFNETICAWKILRQARFTFMAFVPQIFCAILGGVLGRLLASLIAFCMRRRPQVNPG
ncbi:MAG: hypothetical protein U0800_10205 [Isosphaeraceae bacterium]